MKIETAPSNIQIDEIEDLTLFADKSFDTDDVDLFEFTEAQDSPLTPLKTIILSLDREINENILQELSDELDHLQKIWEEDKVAQVYLQGLSKVGRYLTKEGAYAHPNAIKLLLIFFYDFEKIISSHNISGDSISALIKADVHKFKILQHQIDLRGSQAADLPAGEIDAQGEPDKIHGMTNSEQIILLKKAVLELEWEITDSTIKQFNTRLAGVQPQLKNNKSAQVIIQGLQVLGRYLDDERASAHPDAANLIHSFFAALERLAQENIDEAERENILIDRVNRLNNLKMMLADSRADNQTANKFIDEKLQATEPLLTTFPDPDKEKVSSLIEEDLELFFTNVEDKIPSKQNDDKREEEPDSLIFGAAPENVAGSKEITTATPIDNEPLLEIDEQLDVLFEGGGGGDKGSGKNKLDIDKQARKDEFAELESTTFAPALSDAEEQGGFNEETVLSTIGEETNPEINDKLDDFFGEDDRKEDIEVTKPSIKTSFSTSQESLSAAPSLEIIKQRRETIHSLLGSPDHNSEKTALLQLLDSTLALLPEETGQLADDTTNLLDFLHNNIKEDTSDPKIVTVAVARFTAWHKNFLRKLSSTQAQYEPKQDTGISDLHREIEELKKIVSEGIGALRQEIRDQAGRRQRTEDGEQM